MVMGNINKNMFYLSIVQILRFVLPLITLPYLTRVLGVTGIGYISFSLAIMTYMLLISQYGFNFTATARISKIRANDIKINYYFSAVLYSRLLLAILSILIVALFLAFNEDLILTYTVLSMSLMFIGDLFIPTWYFQGMEKMKELSLLTLISRAVSVPFIFICVNNRSDIYIAALFQGAPFLITGVLTLLNVRGNIKIKKVKLSYIKLVVFSSWNVFVTNIASSLYLNVLPVLLGLLSNVNAVGYFNVAQTVRNICVNFFSPVYQAIFPRVNFLVKNDLNQAKVMTKKYFLICISLCFLGISIVILFRENIVMIIAGQEFKASIDAVLIIMFAVFFSVCNNFFGVQSLIPLGKNKALKNIVSISSFVCLIASLPIISQYGFIGAAWLASFAEFFIFVMLIAYHIKYKLKMIL